MHNIFGNQLKNYTTMFVSRILDTVPNSGDFLGLPLKHFLIYLADYLLRL